MSKEEFHNESTAQNLQQGFEQWDAGAPDDRLWNKLNDSLDTEFTVNHQPSEHAQSLSAAFEDWSLGTPDDAVWTKINDDLSVDQVWNRLEDSLGAPVVTNPDQWLKDSYDNWSTGTNHDGWSKLDEALSRERVWGRLNVSLNRPIALGKTWWKYAASLTAFFFLSFWMNDGAMNGTSSFVAENEIQRPTTPTNGGQSVTSENTTPTTIADGTITGGQTQQTQGQQEKKRIDTPNNRQDQQQHLAQQTNGNKEQHTSTVSDLNNTAQAVVSYDLADLNSKGFPEMTCGELGRYSFDLPKPGFVSWTFSAGTQLSIVNENNRSALSSSMPRFGIAADLGFNRHFNRHWGFSQSFGYAEFSQTNGKYVKGRYLNSLQRMSTVQATSSVFYSLNHFDFNAGLVFTRVLNGAEQENNTIINIYNTSSVQAGISCGLSYTFSPRRDRIRYGLGAQYQWIPQINAGNAVFDDVQGMKLQAKISF